MKVKEVIKELETLSPVGYAEDWDNVGLLLGDDEREVHHIMIALDATDEVVEQAVKQQVDMLITHHPMIFQPLKKINNHSMVGRRLWKLAGNRISYYAMHTNFDIKGGMAELAARRLGLVDTEPLEVTLVEAGMPEGIGRVGHLPEPMTIADIASLIKEQFDLENVMLYGDKEKVVWKVAICPGSGKSVIRNALDLNAELLITGDIGHHEGIDAVDEGLMILDATHYGLERIFIPFLEEYLGKVLTKEIRITSVDTGSPIEIL